MSTAAHTSRAMTLKNMSPWSISYACRHIWSTTVTMCRRATGMQPGVEGCFWAA